ncbi:MAG: hypothetical protein ACK4VN_04955 [Bacteroidales bacterium]
MNTQRVPLVAIGLASLVLMIIIGVYLVLRHMQQQATTLASDPYELVPDDANFVFHVKNPALFLQSVTRTGPMASDLEVLLSTGRGFPLLHLADSLLTHHQEPARLLGELSLIISRHPGQTEDENLLLFNLLAPSRASQNQLISLLRSDFLPNSSEQSEKIADHTLWVLTQPGGTTWYYATVQNTLLLSAHRNLLLKALQGAQTGENISSAIAFTGLRNAAGRFADNLYVQTPELYQFGTQFFSIPRLLNIPHLAGWHGWDVTYNPGELLLNGFADPDRRNTTFLTHLAFQQPRQPEMFDKLPRQLAFLLYLGVSETEAFFPSNTPQASLENPTPPLRDYELRFMDVSRLHPDSIYNHWTGELASTGFAGRDSLQSIVLVGCHDCQALLEHPDLQVFLRTHEESASEGQTILAVSIPGFFQSMTRGLVAEDMHFALYSEGYLVAATHEQALYDYLEAMRFGQHFGESNAAVQLQTLLPEKQNLLFHLSPALATPWAQKTTPQQEQSDPRSLQTFSQLSIQWIAGSGNLFFSNALLRHEPGYVISNPLVWETALEAPLHTPPTRVRNHLNGQTEIILQDTLNHLYLIDMEGQVLWKKELSGPVMSEIYQVDIYKNNRLQYLFNTRNYLHLIDRNGAYVSGFPMRLPAPASAGIAVFDYDSNRNYRVIFPAENHRVYNYNLARRPVSGWEYRQSQTLVTRPVQHIRLAGKDFLFLTDTLGTVQILNRRGVSRLHTRQKIQADPRMRIFAALAGNPPYFVIAGKAGEINQLQLDGNMVSFQPDTFSLQYKLVHGNFSDTRQADLIYLDKGNLMVFNASGRRIMTLPLGADLGPWLLQTQNHGTLVGLADSQQKRLFLIDSDASILSPFPVPGDTSFFLENLQNDQYLVVSGLENSLRAYMVTFRQITE